MVAKGVSGMRATTSTSDHSADGLRGPLGQLDGASRTKFAQRIAQRAFSATPHIVASVLTSKLVATSRVVTTPPAAR